jgi:hypothetical protein
LRKTQSPLGSITPGDKEQARVLRVPVLDGRGSGARLDRAQADVRISSLASARGSNAATLAFRERQRIHGRRYSPIFGGSTTG